MRFNVRKNYTGNYYNIVRLPRKFKKRILKKYSIVFSDRYSFLDINQKMWYILSIESPEFHRFLVNSIIKNK